VAFKENSRACFIESHFPRDIHGWGAGFVSKNNLFNSRRESMGELSPRELPEVALPVEEAFCHSIVNFQKKPECDAIPLPLGWAVHGRQKKQIDFRGVLGLS